MPFAARIGDIAGHAGVIVMGSSKVLIGGMMAARVGDMLTCPAFDAKAHVSGNILMGSSSVMIDGAFAARVGDPTSCGINGVSGVGMPASGVPGEIGDQDSLLGDGDVGILWGRYGGYWNDWGKKLELEASLAHAEGETPIGDHIVGGSTDYGNVQLEGHTGRLAFGFDAKYTHLQAEGHGRNARVESAEAGGSLGNVEAMLDILFGTDGRRIGFAFGGALQMSGLEVAAEAEQALVYNFFGLDIRIQELGRGSAMSIGGESQLGTYYDRADSRFHIRHFIDVSNVLGLGGGYDISIGSTPGVGMPGVPGIIVTGCPTVIIGG